MESNFGEVEARLDKQMEVVENALRETLAGRANQQPGEANDEPVEAPSEVLAEEISDLEEKQSPVEPYHPKELDVPPAEPQ